MALTPYFDPPPGCGDDTPYYYDDVVIGNPLLHKDLYNTDVSMVFLDYPFTPSLSPGDEVKFTTCLLNTEVNLCSLKVDWVKDHNNVTHIRKISK